jgi:DNA polymerase V
MYGIMHALSWPVIGEVSAGFPKASEGYEDHPLDLQDLLVTRPAATFFFRVVGEALRTEGVPGGAVLVVDRSLRPRPGKLAVVEEDQSFVVRRLADRDPAVICGIVTASIVRL